MAGEQCEGAHRLLLRGSLRGLFCGCAEAARKGKGIVVSVDELGVSKTPHLRASAPGHFHSKSPGMGALLSFLPGVALPLLAWSCNTSGAVGGQSLRTMESLASFPVSVDWFDSTSDAELLCSVLRCDLHPPACLRPGGVGRGPSLPS